MSDTCTLSSDFRRCGRTASSRSDCVSRARGVASRRRACVVNFRKGLRWSRREKLHISGVVLAEAAREPRECDGAVRVMHWQERATGEELLAARFPKPDVRDSIRRLPMQRAVASTSDAGSNANSAPILEDTTTQHSPETPLEGARDSLFSSPADSQASRLPGPPPRAAAGESSRFQPTASGSISRPTPSFASCWSECGALRVTACRAGSQDFDAARASRPMSASSRRAICRG